MAFTRISNASLNSRGATILPDQPTISAPALKEEFDAPAKKIVAPAVNNLMDELEATTSAGNIGAQAPAGKTWTTVQGAINGITTDVATVATQAHTHTNKAVIDKFDDTGTGLTYDGNPVGAVTSVNSKTGAVVLSASDVGALPSTTAIPTKTSDLTNDSNFVADASYVHTDNNYDATDKAIVSGVTAAIAAKSTVSWNQIDTTGTKIAEITIDGVKTDVKATGGGGSGDTFKTIQAGGTSFVASGEDTFKINAGSNVTITALSSPDKGFSISATGGGQSTGDMLMSQYDNSGDVKAASSTGNGIKDFVATEIGKLDVSDSAVSGQYVSAVSETDGKISVTRASLPTVPTKVSDLTNDSGYQTASDVATAISGKEDKSALKDLAYIAKDGVGSTKVLQGDGTWVNPSAGHTMLPTPSSSVNESAVVNAINNAISVDGGANDDVPSLFGVGVWSNEKNVTVEVHGDTTTIDATGIGDWKEDSELVNPTAQDESGWGWVYVPELIGMGSNHTVDFKLTFDPVACGGPVTLGGYILDDTTGYLCIKFGNEIASPSTAIIGIEVIYKRNGRRVVGS